MTARVCPIHGEYAPTGTCRWCEPVPAKYSRAACDDVPTYMGVPVVLDRSVSSFADAPPMLVNWRTPRYPLVNYLPPEYDHTESIIDAEMHAAEESHLLVQYAALRWERVARRWAGKHRRFNLRDCDIRVFEGMELVVGVNGITLHEEPKP